MSLVALVTAGLEGLASPCPVSWRVFTAAVSRRPGARSLHPGSSTQLFLLSAAGGPAGPPLRARGRPCSTGSPDRGGNHRLVREDHDEELCRSPCRRRPSCPGESLAATTIAQVLRGRSMSISCQGRKCSWPRWALTAPGRSLRFVAGCGRRSRSSLQSGPRIWNGSAPSRDARGEGGDHLDSPGRRPQHRRRAARGARATPRPEPEGDPHLGIRGRARMWLCWNMPTASSCDSAEDPRVSPWLEPEPQRLYDRTPRAQRRWRSSSDRCRCRGEAPRSLPGVPNRLQRYEANGGYVVLDDTFNSNPAGARHALRVLESASARQGRRILVTPGMVELGKTQRLRTPPSRSWQRPRDRSRDRRQDEPGRARRRSRPGGATTTAEARRKREKAVTWARERPRSGRRRSFRERPS